MDVVIRDKDRYIAGSGQGVLEVGTENATKDDMMDEANTGIAKYGKMLADVDPSKEEVRLAISWSLRIVEKKPPAEVAVAVPGE